MTGKEFFTLDIKLIITIVSLCIAIWVWAWNMQGNDNYIHDNNVALQNQINKNEKDIEILKKDQSEMQIKIAEIKTVSDRNYNKNLEIEKKIDKIYDILLTK